MRKKLFVLLFLILILLNINLVLADEIARYYVQRVGPYSISPTLMAYDYHIYLLSGSLPTGLSYSSTYPLGEAHVRIYDVDGEPIDLKANYGDPHCIYALIDTCIGPDFTDVEYDIYEIPAGYYLVTYADTTISHYSNEIVEIKREIECYSDSDCGTDGYVGNPWCYLNGYYWIYRDWSCHNPGTTESYCDYYDSQPWTSCGTSGCDGWGSNYCKNNDVYHSRTCYNTGCSGGYCYSNPYTDEQKVDECSDTVGCTDDFCSSAVCYNTPNDANCPIGYYCDALSGCQPLITCTDLDGDGYGSPGDASCPNGAVEDCDDNNASIHPPSNGMSITQDTTFCPGFYNLPTGIRLGADNIVLDCNDATLSGTASSWEMGVYFESFANENITLKNCNIENYTFNIWISGTNLVNVNLSNNHILYVPEDFWAVGFYVHASEGLFIDTSNTVYGEPIYYYKNCSGIVIKDLVLEAPRVSTMGKITLLNCNNVTVANNTLANNVEGGIELHNSHNNVIDNNKIKGSKWDWSFKLDNSNYNQVKNNEFRDNGGAGIYLRYSDFNNFTGNHIINNSGPYNAGYFSRDSNNNTLMYNLIANNTRGVRFYQYDHGTKFEYNFFENNSEYNIYNEQPNNVSAKNNWWGSNDESYIQSMIFDYYDNNSFGIVDYSSWLDEPCVLPEDGMVITEDTTFCPGTYHLPNGIIFPSDNTVLDCSSSVLIGNNTPGSVGIYLFENKNNTIKNCIIRNYTIGIELGYSDNNTLESNYISYNRYGIQLYIGSENNYLYDNIVCENSQYDIDNVGIYNYGDNNRCNITFLYDDEGTTGCTYSCDTVIKLISNISLGKNAFALDPYGPLDPATTYLFEGEQIIFNVSVDMPIGIEKLQEVYVTVNDDKELICMLIPDPPENPDITAFFECIFTAEPPFFHYGNLDIEVIAESIYGVEDSLYIGNWFFNPVLALGTKDNIINFPDDYGGETVYSDEINITNYSDDNVTLNMFITGTDFYDSIGSGVQCPYTNILELTNLDYYAKIGNYNTSTDPRADSEGYISNIPYGDSFYYGCCDELILGHSEISTNEVATVKFRLNVPSPCNGNFDTGSIFFWGDTAGRGAYIGMGFSLEFNTLQATSYNISLHPGWNLISIPLNLLNNSLAYALSSIEGNYGNVFAYGSWNQLNNDSIINETIGLWIKMLSEDNLTINGTLPVNPVFNLHQGYNLIGYPSLNESNVSYVFGDVISDVENILSYENNSWRSYNPNKNDQLNTLKIIKPGFGYWIDVNKNVSWIFDGRFK